MTLDKQSARYGVALHNNRNKTYSYLFFNHTTPCVPAAEGESKFKMLNSLNFGFLGRESLKNIPLNPKSDSFLAASIISRFDSGLFGKKTLSTKIFGISL